MARIVIEIEDTGTGDLRVSGTGYPDAGQNVLDLRQSPACRLMAAVLDEVGKQAWRRGRKVHGSVTVEPLRTAESGGRVVLGREV